MAQLHDAVKAVAYCHLGSSQAEHPGQLAIVHAERLGFLRHHPVWHATERGIGALIAAGLMPGEPAPEITQTHILWSVKPDRQHPNVVAAFSDGFVEYWPDEFARVRAEMEENYRAWFPEDETFEFFTSVVEIALPAVPSKSDSTA